MKEKQKITTTLLKLNGELHEVNREISEQQTKLEKLVWIKQGILKKIEEGQQMTLEI